MTYDIADKTKEADDRSGRVSRRSLLRGGGAATIAAISLPNVAFARQDNPTPGSNVDIDVIDQFVSEALEQFGVPGAAVTVVQHGEPLLIKGYGVRSIDDGQAVDADTVFQLASNTKPMAAFTYGTFVDEGVVDWSTPASEIIPELRMMDPYATLHTTPRDLLAHRSGLPAFFGELLADLGYDNAEVIRRVRYISPGSTFRDTAAYSNIGYAILGEMISHITGAPWQDAMNERLFAPLGMTRSGASKASHPADGNMLANHAIVDGNLVRIEASELTAIGAGGSALSTANDMAHWIMTLLSGGMADGQQIIQPETVRTMFDPVIPSPVTFTETPPISATAGFSYGLGWGNFHWQGYEILEKGGALDGIRTVVNLVPALGLGIAVVANLNLTFLPEAIRAFILERFIGPAEIDMQAEIASLAVQLDAAFAPPAIPTDPLPLEVPLGNLAGAYEQDLFGYFNVIADGGELRIEAGPAALPGTLTHYGLNTFLLDWGGVTQVPEFLTFVLGPDGQAAAFEHESMGRFQRSMFNG